MLCTIKYHLVSKYVFLFLEKKTCTRRYFIINGKIVARYKYFFREIEEIDNNINSFHVKRICNKGGNYAVMACCQFIEKT